MPAKRAAKPAPPPPKKRISGKGAESKTPPSKASAEVASTGSSASLANFVTQMNKKSKNGTMSADEAKAYDHYKSLNKFAQEKTDIVREWTTKSH